MIQDDADTDLGDYPNDAFDYVILSQTLQATRHPRVVPEHMPQSDILPLCDVVGVKIEKAVALNAWGGAAAAQCALAVLESVRRAGRVPVEPPRLNC